MANTYTLFDLVWKCVVELGIARTGVATGGTTTTLIDTDGLRNVDEDYYEDGTLFILKDAGGAVDISKTFSEIKSFDADTDTITVFDGFASAVTADDTYGVASRRFPLYLLRQKINNELYLSGEIPEEDTSLTTSDTLEYTLPAEIAAQDLRQVLVATNTTSGEKYHVPVVNWRIQWADAGSVSKLVLEKKLDSGYELLLRYVQPHTELRAATDKLHVSIHPDRVVYQVCADALRWYRNKTRLRHLDDSIDMLELKAQRAKDKHPLPPLPSRQSKITRVSRTLKMRGY